MLKIVIENIEEGVWVIVTRIVVKLTASQYTSPFPKSVWQLTLA